MPLDTVTIEKIASTLYEAEKSRVQIPLISQMYPSMDMDDAYSIQAALVEQKRAGGNTIRGWKIGLTSKAMQSALNIDVPDSGVLFEDMFFENRSTIPAGRFIQTRIEAEIAFIMRSSLQGDSVGREDVMLATQSVAPALEILDTRIIRQDPETGAIRIIVDTIADNAANAGIVLGDERHPPDSLDMRWVGAIVSRNGEVEETGLGAGVLNDPVTGIVWLVQRLANYGLGLKAGDVVLSGSFIRPVEARSGDTFLADYGTFGKVECNFA